MIIYTPMIVIISYSCRLNATKRKQGKFIGADGVSISCRIGSSSSRFQRINSSSLRLSSLCGEIKSTSNPVVDTIVDTSPTGSTETTQLPFPLNSSCLSLDTTHQLNRKKTLDKMGMPEELDTSKIDFEFPQKDLLSVRSSFSTLHKILSIN